jgi:hypothetical protein
MPAAVPHEDGTLEVSHGLDEGLDLLGFGNRGWGGKKEDRDHASSMAGAAWTKEMREAEESEGAEESGKRKGHSTGRFPSALLSSSANLRL